MKCIDQLEQEFYSGGDEVVVRGLPYIKALRLFDRVVSSCFGMTLQPGYEEAIESFHKAYLELEISVTPKVNSFIVKQGSFKFLF